MDARRPAHQFRHFSSRPIGRCKPSRLPAEFQRRTAGDRDFADAGALLSFGPSVIDTFKRTANYVDKILKGAKPADLPIEQPTVFELIVNEKTAKALGLKIPESIQLRADEVIR